MMPGHVILQNKEVAGVSEEAMAILLEYNYPGNVRELENIIEHAFVLCSSGLIENRHLPPQFRGKGDIDTLKVKRGVTLKSLEAIHIAYTIHTFMMLTTELRPGNSASIPARFFARSSHWGSNCRKKTAAAERGLSIAICNHTPLGHSQITRVSL